MQFVLLTLAASAVLLIGTSLLAESAARRLALAEAERRGGALATRLAAPLVNSGVRAGVPGAADDLTTVLTNRMQDGSIFRLKIWDEDGRVLWADDRTLIGKTFEVDDEMRDLFTTGGVVAGVSDLERAENVTESDEATELLEVYAGARDADGVPLVVETYLTTDVVDEYTATIVRQFIPILVGAVVMLMGIVLPLARSLTRQVRRAEEAVSTLSRRAVLASDLERRRVAEDLHHGVIQELAGLGYALPSLARSVAGDGDRERASARILEAERIVNRNLGSLRTLMSDIYPPDLTAGRLNEEIAGHVRARAAEHGLEAEVLADAPAVDEDTARLVFGLVREAVINVVKHARATRVDVDVRAEGEELVVRVRDDGVGPGPTPGESPAGHLGLRLLRDSLHDMGGSLGVTPGAAGGTQVVARLPLSRSTPA